MYGKPYQGFESLSSATRLRLRSIGGSKRLQRRSDGCAVASGVESLSIHSGHIGNTSFLAAELPAAMSPGSRSMRTGALILALLLLAPTWSGEASDKAVLIELEP